MSVDTIFALRLPLVWTPAVAFSALGRKLFGKLTVQDLPMLSVGIGARVEKSLLKSPLNHGII
jgi:hypothetical protein